MFLHVDSSFSGNNFGISLLYHSLRCMLADNLFSQLLFVWKSLYYLQLWKIFIVNIKLQLFRTFQPVLQDHSIIFWFAGFLMKNVSSFFFSVFDVSFVSGWLQDFPFILSAIWILLVSACLCLERVCVCVCARTCLWYYLSLFTFGVHWFLSLLFEISWQLSIQIFLLSSLSGTPILYS